MFEIQCDISAVCEYLGCCVMFLLAMVSSLCFIGSNGNTAVYKEILEHFIRPSVDEPYGDTGFLFQQDFTPNHSTKTTTVPNGLLTMLLYGEKLVSKVSWYDLQSKIYKCVEWFLCNFAYSQMCDPVTWSPRMTETVTNFNLITG